MKAAATLLLSVVRLVEASALLLYPALLWSCEEEAARALVP